MARLSPGRSAGSEEIPLTTEGKESTEEITETGISIINGRRECEAFFVFSVGSVVKLVAMAMTEWQ